VATVGRGGAWSKDGVIVFAPGTQVALQRVSAGGGPTEPATKMDLTRGENSHRWPYFLPDGRHFLFWSRNSRGLQENAIYLETLASLDARALLKGETMAVYVPGYLLFLRDQTLMAQGFNAGRLEARGSPVPIAENIAMNSTTIRPVFSASDNGTLIYQTGNERGGWRLLWFARDGKPVGAVADLDRYFDPTISFDGTRIAADLLTSQGTGDIWIFDLVRKAKTRLTFGPTTQRYPVWTPDGKMIYYGSNRKGGYHIYAKAANGNGPEEVILEDEDSFEFPEDVSSDQKYLVYLRAGTANNNTSTELWALPLTGEHKPFPIVRSAFNISAAAVAPNGRWMAYGSNESGRFEVYLTAFPGGGGVKWQVSTNGGANPKWRRDSRELFFLDPADNLMAVDVNASSDNVQLGTPQALFRSLGVQNTLGLMTLRPTAKSSSSTVAR
jgi:eukaryotic-like serine/threonine-protein kinase